MLYDYFKGKGDSTIQVYVNMSPEDIFWLYNAMCSHLDFFEWEQQKIFGQPDQKGYCQMTKLRMARSAVDKNGEVRKFPWCISGENGIGIAQHTKVGGTYCKSGTYKSQKAVFINISDHDFFVMVNKVVRFIQQFENAFCPSIIRQGKQAYLKQTEQKQQMA